MLFSLSGFSLSLHDYTIQDDARQHVFWLQQLNDSELFSNDLIANYFRSVAPLGYKCLYWLANLLGFEPFVFNKILPLLLGVGTSIYLFLVTLEIFPVPLAGFWATLLLNQNLWLMDDLVSGTPRAFFYILFLGFIYHLLRQQLLPCLLLIVWQGLFYPQVVLISVGILCLNLATQKHPTYFYLSGLVIGAAVLRLYKLQTGEFTEVITLEAAKKLPEFTSLGRSTFFLSNPWSFWLTARRSGFFPFEWQYFAMCSFGLLLPLITKFSQQFPLVKQLKPQAGIIWQIIFTSLGWFLLSHLMLFRLHLPSRYSQHTWRITIALLTGITVTILLHKLISKVAKHSSIRQIIILAIALGALLYPTYAVQSHPYRLGYVTGQATELYQFLQRQPKDVVIATLSPEGDFIPSLAQRTVLTAKEYSIPYHWDYYEQIRQRTKDLIYAQYSPSSEDLRQFIQKYDIDLWLLDRTALTPAYLAQNNWLRQFQPETSQAIANLEKSYQPAIGKQIDSCTIFKTSELYLLNAQCIVIRS